MAIIEDNKNEIIENLTMSDDGTGYTVNIIYKFRYKYQAFLYQNLMEKPWQIIWKNKLLIQSLFNY